MTTGGWIFLILAWSIIFAIVGFCYRIILGGGSEYEHHE